MILDQTASLLRQLFESPGGILFLILIWLPLAKRMLDNLYVHWLKKHDLEQSWFWSKNWQETERLIDEELARGEYETFDTMDEFLDDLYDEKPKRKRLILDDDGELKEDA